MLFKQPLLDQPWVDCIFIRKLVDWFEQCANRKKKKEKEKNTDCIFLEIILRKQRHLSYMKFTWWKEICWSRDSLFHWQKKVEERMTIFCCTIFMHLTRRFFWKVLCLSNLDIREDSENSNHCYSTRSTKYSTTLKVSVYFYTLMELQESDSLLLLFISIASCTWPCDSGQFFPRGNRDEDVHASTSERVEEPPTRSCDLKMHLLLNKPSLLDDFVWNMNTQHFDQPTVLRRVEAVQ